LIVRLRCFMLGEGDSSNSNVMCCFKALPSHYSWSTSLFRPLVSIESHDIIGHLLTLYNLGKPRVTGFGRGLCLAKPTASCNPMPGTWQPTGDVEPNPLILLIVLEDPSTTVAIPGTCSLSRLLKQTRHRLLFTPSRTSLRPAHVSLNQMPDS
jgi:hypothetical protein